MEQVLPVASTTPQAPSLGARFGIRAGAQVIDLILHNLISVAVGAAIGLAIGIYAVATHSSATVLVSKLQASSLIGYILPLAGYIFYHAICEGIHGATLGKLIFKTHVFTEDGNPVSMGAAIIRSAAFFIDSLVFGIVAAASMRSSDLQQRLGDKWAKTVVVERSNVDKSLLPSGWKFLAAFLLAVAVDGLFIALSLIIKLF